MNATAEKVEAQAVRQVSVNGYIDAVTNKRIYGWAWDAQKPDAKIAVRLQAGGNTVGIVAADLPREDLKASGIGDGAHAFEAAIPDGVSPNDISVLVVCPDTGRTVELSPRAIAGRAEGGGGQDLRSAVETLAKSHGFMHRKLQTIAAAMAESRRNGAPEASDDGVPSSAADVAPLSRLQTLEEAVLRLDALVKQQETMIAAMRDRPSDPMPRFLAIAAAVLSAMALLVAFVQ
jgi:hypothetical protein